MRRSKISAIAILLFGGVAFGLTACGDRNKEQTQGTIERSGPSDAAKGPANPANPQGPSGPTQGPSDPTQSPSSPTEKGTSR